MLLSFLSSAEKIRIATTAEECEAVFRFRYSVYYKELGWDYGGVDHAREMIHDDHDREPGTFILYAGDLGSVKGTVRIRVFERGNVPADVREYYSTNLFPNIDSLRVAELGRLMIRPSLRGRLVLPSLVHRAYDLIAGEQEVDLTFCDCRPGLVAHYRRLGARPYGARLNHLPHGVQVPLVWVVSDHDYFKAVGAVATSQVKKHFGKGRRAPVDTTPFEHLFEEDNQQIQTSAERVWLEMQHQIGRAPEQTPSVLDGLSEKVTRELSKGNMILEVKAGDEVTTEGSTERELFLILDGTFEVVSYGHLVQTLREGEVFGEVAFFRDSHMRSATVRAATDGRVLVLRRNFLVKLNTRDPEAAFTILWNLGRVLAERLVDTTGMLPSIKEPREHAVEDSAPTG